MDLPLGSCSEFIGGFGDNWFGRAWPRLWPIQWLACLRSSLEFLFLRIFVLPVGNRGLAGGHALAIIWFNCRTRRPKKWFCCSACVRSGALRQGSCGVTMDSQPASSTAMPEFRQARCHAIARVSGETAPLLRHSAIAGYNFYLDQPMASSQQITNYTTGPVRSNKWN